MQCVSSAVNGDSKLDSSSFARLVPEYLEDISLEDQVLLVGARIYLGYDEIEPLQRLLHQANVIDWQYLVQNAEHHGFIPILYQVLKQCRKPQVPQETFELLKRKLFGMAYYNQYLIQTLVTLTERLQSVGLDILAFKGPTLALMAYGDLSLRQPGDLDFLVAPESFEQASQWFQAQGYAVQAEYTWATCFRHRSRKIEIDLHKTVAGNYLPFQIDFKGILERRKQTKGTGIRLSQPCAEDLLILLCVQLAKDTHDYKRKLIKVYDIAVLINRSSLNWSLILAIAHQCKGDRPLKLGLSIIEILFGVELPATIRAYAHSDWVVKHYCRCICKELFTARSAHRSFPGLVWRALFLFQHLLLEGQDNRRLVKLFMQSVVNKVQKRWSNIFPWKLAGAGIEEVSDRTMASLEKNHNR